MGMREAIDGFNEAHPWSHNDAFAGFVLRHGRAVRHRGGRTAIDVGCGTGNLVSRLSGVFPEVVGIEPDQDAAARAAARFKSDTGVRIEMRAFGDEETERADLVVFVASLHHMPLSQALEQARLLLRPGGRIVIVGVAREGHGDAGRSLLSAILNPIVGFLRHPSRAGATPDHMQAPTASASDSFDEIRDVARSVLPGIRMRRRLFWRYTATWSAPDACP